MKHVVTAEQKFVNEMATAADDLEELCCGLESLLGEIRNQYYRLQYHRRKEAELKEKDTEHPLQIYF